MVRPKVSVAVGSSSSKLNSWTGKVTESMSTRTRPSRCKLTSTVRQGGLSSVTSLGSSTQLGPPATVPTAGSSSQHSGWRLVEQSSLNSSSPSTRRSWTSSIFCRFFGSRSYLLDKRISKSSQAPTRRLSVGKPVPGTTWNSGVWKL